MVLADESFTDLSKYFQRDARVLDYAERIFFDVRERLSADLLISYWCFGRPSHEDTYDEAIRKELLSNGYSLGPQYLRHLLEEIGARKAQPKYLRGVGRGTNLFDCVRPFLRSDLSAFAV